MPITGARARAELVGRLEARREEIEDAALTRIAAISDPAEVSDPAYAEGLHRALAAAVGYGIEATRREGTGGPIPVELLAQAGMAARVGIPLDTVLRRYFAGYSLLGYFILEEAAKIGITDAGKLKHLFGTGLFDRLLKAVGEEYERERVRRKGSAGERRAEIVKRLLAGELLDTTALGYEMDGFHTAVVLNGPGAVLAARGLGEALDRRLLVIDLELDATAVWLGGRDALDSKQIEQRIRQLGWDGISVGIGEPAAGTSGWRLSYRQAAAAFAIAIREPKTVVTYTGAALLAAAVDSDLLGTSLRKLFIAPLLGDDRDRGALVLETLRAYFAAERNAASAAAALGLSRQGVTGRLRLIGKRLGRTVNSCAPELEVALRLHDLGEPASPMLEERYTPDKGQDGGQPGLRIAASAGGQP